MRLIRAILAGLRELLRAHDRVGEPCSRGHVMHVTWKSCPLCAMLPHETATQEAPRVAIGIRDGKGEFRNVLLGRGRYTIGFEATCDVVVTPTTLPVSRIERGDLSVTDGQVQLTMVDGSGHFSIDGVNYRDAVLYDRDRLEGFQSQIEVLVLPRGGA